MLRRSHTTVWNGIVRHAEETYQWSFHGLPLKVGRISHTKGLVGCAPSSGVLSSRSTASSATFISPPDDLEDGYFERPTPLLLIAGEAQPPAWWSRTVSFLTSRGCTVGTMALSGRGSSPEDTLTLKALQTGVAAAVDHSGLTPPVLVAHSMAGFVCQQYLQSYPAAGLVLLDSFPPQPSWLAKEHLALIRSGDMSVSSTSDPAVKGLGLEELANLVKDTPSQWEERLRRHFDAFHGKSPWEGVRLYRGDTEEQAPAKRYPSTDLDAEPLGTLKPRFPSKAFAQMCLDVPSSSLRLERHVVETLVLGSRGHPVDAVHSRDFLALEAARMKGLKAICEFHGLDGWRSVDAQGRVEGLDRFETKSWLDEMWDWYDARF